MIADQQNQIFDELRQMDPGIIDDGVPDETAYLSARYRIMYVLKEVNGGPCERLLSLLRIVRCSERNYDGERYNHTAGRL